MLLRTFGLVGFAVAACCIAEVRAELVAQYTFNSGTVSAGSTPFADEKTDDSLGINPVLTFVDPTGLGSLTGGQADLTNNNDRNSNQDWNGGNAAGTYLDLDNFAISDTAYFGGNRAITIEMWGTIQEYRNWSRFFDFGASNGAEDESTGAEGQNYMIVSPRSGRGTVNGVLDPFTASTRSNDTGNPELTVPAPDATQIPPLSLGQEHHVVYVLDHNNTAGGANPNGTLSVYIDNMPAASGPIAPQFDVTADPLSGGTAELNDINNWFGRAQFGDPLFDGYFNEIRIYSHALTAGEVNSSYMTGPVALPLPVVNIDRLTGDVSFVNSAQNNGDLTLIDYTLTSPDGAFDVSAFDPIDPPATTATSATLAELGIGSGGTISPGNSLSIGNAHTPSSIENVQALVKLSDGTTTNVLVNFVGNGGQPLSALDLTANGEVDADDVRAFAAHAFTDISGLTAVRQALAGDMDRDGDVDFNDFVEFKQGFNALFGAGAMEGIVASAGAHVPEPTSLVLFGVMASGLFLFRRSSATVNFRKLRVLSLIWFVAATAGLMASNAHAVLVHSYHTDAGITANGGTGVIASWEDQTGSYDLTATVTPLLTAAGTPSGLPSVTFDITAPPDDNDAFAGTLNPGANPGDPPTTGFAIGGATQFTAAVAFNPAVDFGVDNDVNNNQFWGHLQLINADKGGGAPDWGLSWGPDENGSNNVWFGVGENTGGGTPTITTSGATPGNWYVTVAAWDGTQGANSSINLWLYDDEGTLVSTASQLVPNATAGRVDVGMALAREVGNAVARTYIGQMGGIEIYNNAVNSTGAASIADGLLSKYLGANVAQTLQLVVDGNNLSIRNPNSSSDISIEYYEISSTNPAFNTSNGVWNSLDDQGIDEGSGKPDGDFNNNGVVDAADYTVWRDNLGSTGGLPNDGGLGGTVDSTYYDLWKNNFGETGSGTGVGWLEAGGSDADFLAEFFVTEGGSTLAANSSWSLGSPFSGSIGNLTFKYSINGVLLEGGIVAAASLQAVSAPEPGAALMLISCAGLTIAADVRSRLRKRVGHVTCGGDETGAAASMGAVR